MWRKMPQSPHYIAHSIKGDVVTIITTIVGANVRRNVMSQWAPSLPNAAIIPWGQLEVNTLIK